MEKQHRISIYKRVSKEFNVNKFKKYYYCANINYFTLLDKLKEQYSSARIMVRTDHVVVISITGELHLFLLSSHSSGKCAAFLHD